MSGFAGRVAVVTGAGGAIARRTAERLAELGAEVWCLDLAFEAESVGGSGSAPLREVPVDVTDSEAVAAVFARIAAGGTPATLLVNGAGGPGRKRTPIDGVTDEDWARVTALNLDAPFYCTREAARWMKQSGAGGSVVNISSGAGRTSSRTGVQAYAAAKAGVIGFTRQTARELGPFGIRVNCVAPGLIDVPGIHDEVASIPDDAMRAHLDGVALGRLGAAEDLVEPIVFFLGDGAAYVSGQTISVDGGHTMLG